MTIKFHSLARKDFFDDSEYYEEQMGGLGDVFIDEVEKVLDVIEQQPFSGTKITETERRFLVSRFSLRDYLFSRRKSDCNICRYEPKAKTRLLEIEKITSIPIVFRFKSKSQG